MLVRLRQAVNHPYLVVYSASNAGGAGASGALGGAFRRIQAGLLFSDFLFISFLGFYLSNLSRLSLFLNFSFFGFSYVKKHKRSQHHGRGN
jgi:hypothetical protein